LSPDDGGAATSGSRDSFEVSKEVAIALSRLQQIGEPPEKLRGAPEVAKAILRFWETYAGKKLVARRSLIDSL
jgi:hypothetical protein